METLRRDYLKLYGDIFIEILDQFIPPCPIRSSVAKVLWECLCCVSEPDPNASTYFNIPLCMRKRSTAPYKAEPCKRAPLTEGAIEK